MRLIVSGPRTGYPQDEIDRILDRYLAQYGDDLVIIEGCAKGVDTQAWEWAKKRGIEKRVIHYPAPWDHLIMAAGHWRNSAMIRVAQADAVVIFHPDIKNGRGSKDMALAGAREGIQVHLVGSTMPL